MIRPCEKHYQPGNIIKIREEPPKARKLGFLLGSTHVIQPPPKNHINSAMAVWINDKNEKPFYLQFPYWIWTGKIAVPKVKRIRKVVNTKVKRMRKF